MLLGGADARAVQRGDRRLRARARLELHEPAPSASRDLHVRQRAHFFKDTTQVRLAHARVEAAHEHRQRRRAAGRRRRPRGRQRSDSTRVLAARTRSSLRLEHDIRVCLAAALGRPAVRRREPGARGTRGPGDDVTETVFPRQREREPHRADPHGVPCISTSAASRSRSSANRTNPNPLLRPVRGSVTTRALRTDAYRATNVSCNAKSFTSGGKSPTNALCSSVKGFFFCRDWFGWFGMNASDETGGLAPPSPPVS